MHPPMAISGNSFGSHELGIRPFIGPQAGACQDLAFQPHLTSPRSGQPVRSSTHDACMRSCSSSSPRVSRRGLMDTGFLGGSPRCPRPACCPDYAGTACWQPLRQLVGVCVEDQAQGAGVPLQLERNSAPSRGVEHVGSQPWWVLQGYFPASSRHRSFIPRRSYWNLTAEQLG